MREIFLKHKIAIFRILGSVMLIVGIAAYFWLAPKEVVTENEIAAANIARMEASVSGSSSASGKSSQPSASKFIEELKNAQKKQVEYMTILAIVLGAGFLLYSFMGKKEER